MNKTLFVTQPWLPPLGEFIPYLEQIWSSRVLTNGGPFHRQLEEALAEYLEVPHVALFTNATIALLTALQALRVTGEVVTTPYSFVATSHSLLWNGLTPVFADIDPVTLNLSAAAVEAAVTKKTTAILPVHCYGHPCDTDGIRGVAERHGLRVIYDAAHAFGVRDGGGSVLRHGDLSVLSFHATKVFNTFEGGAIICHDEQTKLHIDKLKNFGHDGETSVVEAGINGKMSEFNAALGLLQLKHMDNVTALRRAIDSRYREGLAGTRGIHCLEPVPGEVPNYSYFPVLVGDDYRITRDELNDRLKAAGIWPRRYFYPLISDFPMYRDLPSANPGNLPHATTATRQVLCLPIYPTLDRADVDRIIEIVDGCRR